MGKIPDIKIFADGANLGDVPRLIRQYCVKGFTTNPTLMAKAKVRDYERFAKSLLDVAQGLPVSLEVFADTFGEMKEQALKLASWGENVYVKIPATDTSGRPSTELIASLSVARVKVNVTAVFTKEQIDSLIPQFHPDASAILSVFAGRIADAGVDPGPIIRHALEGARAKPKLEVLWASCREIYSIVVAAQQGCHIITVPYDMLPKLDLFGKDLAEFSLETVRMFHRDAATSGYQI